MRWRISARLDEWHLVVLARQHELPRGRESVWAKKLGTAGFRGFRAFTRTLSAV